MISTVESPAIPVRRPSISRKTKLWTLGFLLIGSISVAVSKFHHWDERLFFDLKSHLNASVWKGKSIWLPGYSAYIDAKPVKGIEQNLSSIVYDYDQDRLLAVINDGPTELVALSKTGNVTGHYPLVGFEDIEGLAYMGGGRVVIVDERTQQLSFFQLPATPQSIHADDVQSLSLGFHLNGNKGFEGVTYDAETDRLFVVKERNPRQLYEISGMGSSLGQRMQIKIRDLTSWIDDKVFATDLSDIHFDPKTKHLVILSDESKLMVEMTTEGELVSFRNLVGWLSELKQSAPQPEGVTLDKDGNLYVVSEPNLFYAFRKH
ncbi:SdiA-regulated domain-containing protein [Pseudomonas sp. BN102]|uniref:SdiA-regulated domain-containing protein n=1 Tax=Pseudomonas sp. BN102 TaxID=2567886 RepID=UPI002458F512|nr:SdiA-regulated domain-containing protein [Pseudomonas sp. BN102]MDH4612648.1 DNA-binding protein [Pseudomonas sp. BN102]